MLSLIGHSFESERHQDSPLCFQIIVVVGSLFCFFVFCFRILPHIFSECVATGKSLLSSVSFFSVFFSLAIFKRTQEFVISLVLQFLYKFALVLQ